MSVDSALAGRPQPVASESARRRLRSLRLPGPPELIGLLGLTAVLNLWGLSVNGWANTYYSAAVRSMTESWHNFLFISLDHSGLMTVDKPPLSLWVQALSARVFGVHPLSLLVPQALMGVLAVGLLYDLVRRRFGRLAGAVGGLVLATTPIVVAVARHNNPDELLVLCSVAALWAGLRALDTGRARWLVLCSIAVGLGFETKMGVALFVVPGLALAWVWMRIVPALGGRSRWRATVQLLWGGLAMVVVAGAWPLLVTLTPAADRPWISGTSDNSVWSLIFGYNGLGRVAGQTGGPGGGGGPGRFGGGPGGGGPGGSLFGGSTGPGRLLQSGLGDQAGWLLGFALVAGFGLLLLTRLRRRDPRSGWLIVVGGAFLTTAVVFSFAGGIFHPYYVSLLAPFTAALIGGGVGQMVSLTRDPGSSPWSRLWAPAALVAGGITELVVLGGVDGRLAWATPLAVAGVVLGIGLWLVLRTPRLRTVALLAAFAALLAAPVTWAAETIGHTTSATFPAGGPATADGGPGGPGGFGTRRFRFGGGLPGGFGPGAGGAPSRGFAPGAGGPPGFVPGARGGFGPPAGAGGPGAGGLFGRAGGPGGGGPFGGDSSTLRSAIAYARAHGGGTIGVDSQSSAAAAIIEQNGDVAGLGGFSGRESTVSVAWLADEVAAGRLRWIIAGDGPVGRLPGDTRQGSTTALAAAAKVCRAVPLSRVASGAGVAANGVPETAASTSQSLLDCAGRAAAIRQAGQGR